MDGAEKNPAPVENEDVKNEQVEEAGEKNENIDIATTLKLGKVANKVTELEGGVESGSSESGDEDVALILGEADKQDMDTAVNEAVEKKFAEKRNRAEGFIKNNFIIKPILAAYYRTVASSAVKNAGGDVSAAFESLGLENTSKINREQEDYKELRARLALEETGFADKIDADKSFVLNEGEKIEKVQDEKTQKVNNELKKLYKKLEEAYANKDKEAYKKARTEFKEQVDQWWDEGTFGNKQNGIADKFFDNKVVKFLIGDKSKKNITNLDALDKAANGVEDLVRHKVSSERFNEYLDAGHLSLYNAELKSGLNTKQKVNNVMAAVAAGGVVGGIAYTLLARDARTAVKAQAAKAVAEGVASDALAGAAAGAVTGGFAGAAAGAIRGVQHAGVKVSESEIKHATDAEAILTAEEKAAKRAEEATKEAEASSEEAENEAEEEAAEAEEKVDEIENKSAKKKSIFNKVAEFKKKITGEDKYLEKIEEIRDRKSAKELYDSLNNKSIIMKLFNAGSKEERKKLMQELEKSDPDGLKDALSELVRDENMYSVNKKGKKKFNIFGKKKNKMPEEGDAFSRANRLLENSANKEIAKKNLEKVLAEVRARNSVSAKLKIDLIKYSEGNTAKERFLLGQKIMESEKLVDTDRVKYMVMSRVAELEKVNKSASSEVAKLMVRQAVVDAVTGGAMGAAAGAIFGAVKGIRAGQKAEQVSNATETADSEAAEAGEVAETGEATDTVEGAEITEEVEAEPQPVSFEEDENGGYAMFVGEGEAKVQIVGEGDESGINFDLQTGQISDDDLNMLRDRGIDIEQLKVDTETLTGGRGTMSAEDFFNIEKHAERFGEKANEAGYKIEGISIKGWVAAQGSNRAADITSFETVNEGDLTAKVVTLDENIPTEGLKVVLRPTGEGETAFTFDVAEDGTVTIPAGTPAAMSMFEGDTFKGGSIQVVRAIEDRDGFESLGTITNRGANMTTEISFVDEIQKENYVYSLNGAEFKMPEEARVDIDLEQAANVPELRSSGPVEFTSTEEGSITVNGIMADDSETPLQLPRRTGNFNELYDPALSGNKEKPALNGENLVREIMDPDYDMEPAEVEKAFTDAVEDGSLTTNMVMEEYLKQMGNSPEQIVTMRAMLGDLRFDIDGDGDLELIDTDWEVNAVADILRDSAEPDGYSAFVNDTYDLLYEKLDGGEIRLVKYADEPYDFTTLGYLDKVNNFVQVFARKKTACDGLGLELLDKDGKSIYDLKIARKIWNMPSNAKLDHVTERLNCCQKTADVHWVKVAKKVAPQTTPAPTPGSDPAAENPTTPAPSSDVNAENPGSDANAENPGSDKNAENPVSDKSAENPVSDQDAENPVSDKNVENPSDYDAENPVSDKNAENPSDYNAENPTPAPSDYNAENPTPAPSDYNAENPTPPPSDVVAENPKTDENHQGNDANPDTGTTPEFHEDNNPVQAGEESVPEENTEGVNTDSEDQQDWAEEPSEPEEDTGTGGTVDNTAGMTDEDAAAAFADRFE
ncbi:hypothetical protein J6S35_01390 [Candidatus Saccharibacteria bacterium]|nr:hypothetical protein [Candidatus Saccharibacteria bacterium]